MTTAEREAFISSLTRLYESNARRYRLSASATKLYVAEQVARRLKEQG